MDGVAPHLDDSERVGMTGTERTVWASGVAVVLTSGGYFALMVSRLRSQPVAEISWVAPMLWTIGLAVAGAMVLAIGMAIVGAIRERAVSGAATCDPVTADVRDREISRSGSGASMQVIGVGFGGALVLAMLDADSFWIGNLLFVFGTAGALVEAATKIALYRRGF